MKANESNRGYDPDRQERIERRTDRQTQPRPRRAGRGAVERRPARTGRARRRRRVMAGYRAQRFIAQSSRRSSAWSACRTSERRSRGCIPRSAGSPSSNSIAASPMSIASRATSERDTDSRRCSSRRRFVASSSSRSRRDVTTPNRTLSSGPESESSSCMTVYDAPTHFNLGGRA